MPKGSKKRAKLKKTQEGGHPAGSDDGGNNNTTTTNTHRRDAAAGDGNHLSIPSKVSHVDVSEDSMESSEEMVTPRAGASEADEDEKKAAEVPVERAVEVVEEDGSGEAGEEVMVDALPPEAGEQEQEGKVDAKSEAHDVVQKPEVQDVVVSEAPAVQESEEVAVREGAKVHPVHEPEPTADEVVLREAAKAAVVLEPEAKVDAVVVSDVAEVSRSREAAGVHGTEVVVRGPAVSVAATVHRATWWNCCGLFDAFSGSWR